MARKLDTLPQITKEEKSHPTNCGHTNILLKGSWAHNSGIIGSISDNQYKSNETTSQAIKQLLDYCDTHPYTTI